MAPSTPFLSIFALLVATRLALAGTRCPSIDDIGHGPDGQWTLNRLDWKRTRKTTGTWPPQEWDMDEAEVTFQISSPFNNAGNITCTARAVEFSEEYKRQLAGKEPTYGWWPCKGAKEDEGLLSTEFQLKWFPEHELSIRQGWWCIPPGGDAMPWRATGDAPYQIITGNIDCKFDSNSARTNCDWAGTYPRSREFTATQVRILPPPPSDCMAASLAKPDFKISDFKWWTNYTLGGPFFPRPYQNVSFNLQNDALEGYSTRMICSAESMFQPLGGAPGPPFYYKCDVFEADPFDVPKTTFDWNRDGSRLTVAQTWGCDTSGGGQRTFTSTGSIDVRPLLDCRTVTVAHPPYTAEWPADNAQACVAKSVIPVKGTLK